MALGIQGGRCYIQDQLGVDQALQAAVEKGLTMRLARDASAYIVTEMLRVLGDRLTLEILEVNPARLKLLASERGCLSRAQLERISARTGTSWPRWMVEGSAPLAKTAKARTFVERARKMWDEIDGRTMPWPTSAPARPSRVSALRHAI